MQALLATRGKSFSKHSGVVAAFNREFIKTGILPKAFGRKIKKLAKNREIGDYSYTSSLTAEQVAENIQDAERILSAIANLIQQQKKRNQ
jgi:hypothetical protein